MTKTKKVKGWRKILRSYLKCRFETKVYKSDLSHIFYEVIEPYADKEIKRAKREILERVKIKKLKEENFDGRTHQAKHQIWVRGFNDAIAKLNQLKKEIEEGR